MIRSATLLFAAVSALALASCACMQPKQTATATASQCNDCSTCCTPSKMGACCAPDKKS